ncbi:MAG: nucleotidyltransferase domain-containing protein [Nitrososphaerota archaeon]|nr:nucleotidyltransferase domain-containing protein [Candidatus Calditenuis fumarioli]
MAEEGTAYRKVVYDERRWRILREKRGVAERILSVLHQVGITDAFVYGSVARGDVDEDSDVDAFIPHTVNPELLQARIEEALGGWARRVVVQATPTYAVKGYIYLDELTSISFPLVEMLPSEHEFYNVAGKIDLDGIRRGIRVPGMNKSLMAIIPVEDGHLEYPVELDVEKAAKLIGVNPRALRERVRVLRRRRDHGRTGLYRELELSGEETFSGVLKRLIETNPHLRRRMV